MHEHTPVLLAEALEGLEIKADGTYLDATFGRGGHAGAILMRLGASGRLLAVDRDPAAIVAARAQFGGDARFSIVHGSFGDLARLVPAALAARGLDGVLFDLGVSSAQLDDPTRGFSFQQDGALDMRMDPTRGESAAQWLARAPESELTEVLFTLGEERFARRVARAIVQRRATQPILRTTELAQIVAGAVRTREPGKHPATRTFQAVRMRVNHELEEIERGLQAALDLLANGGRLCVIAFHSLEDRAAKRFMRRHATVDPVYAGLPHVPESARPTLRLVGKAQRAGAAELGANPRARSATLRVAEKITRAAA